MIHNIEPKFFDNSYRQETPDADSCIVFIQDNAVLVKETEEGIVLPSPGAMELPLSSFTYLFSIDNHKFFLAPAAQPWGDFAYLDMMEFRKKRPKHMAFAAATASQLYNWYSRNRYCGRCGKEMVQDEKERMLRCESCGNMVYPKISPAVIVGVTDGERLLLTKYAGRIYKNYALIAGFSEIGEPIEDTVRREVLEEAGVRVKNIRFYKSQPWPFSDTLLMGFYCDLDGSDTIVMDETELDVAEWVRREDISVQADDISLTNEMIINFKEHGV
jgi:NAD+ diphosphatase